MRAVTKAGLIVAAASALAACDPYYMGDPGYPGPGYPDRGYGGYPPPGPGYPGGYPNQPGSPPRPGQIVETIGCVTPGVEYRCQVLRAQDGRSWNISGTQPAPPVMGEWAIRATGRVAVSARGYCQEGMLLTEVRWDYTTLRCREGRVQGYQGY